MIESIKMPSPSDPESLLDLARRDLATDQPAAAEAEHRIELVQLLDAQANLLGRDAELLPEILLLLRRVRQEFV